MYSLQMMKILSGSMLVSYWHLTVNSSLSILRRVIYVILLQVFYTTLEVTWDAQQSPGPELLRQMLRCLTSDCVWHGT